MEARNELEHFLIAEKEELSTQNSIFSNEILQ